MDTLRISAKEVEAAESSMTISIASEIVTRCIEGSYLDQKKYVAFTAKRSRSRLCCARMS
jgi:hypothetical protein